MSFTIAAVYLDNLLGASSRSNKMLITANFCPREYLNKFLHTSFRYLFSLKKFLDVEILYKITFNVYLFEKIKKDRKTNVNINFHRFEG